MVDSDLRIVPLRHDLGVIDVFTFHVIGDEGVAQIDTGTNGCYKQVYQSLQNALSPLKVSNRFLLNTHFHGDHAGSNYQLAHRFGMLTVCSSTNASYLSNHIHYRSHLSSLLEQSYNAYLDQFWLGFAAELDNEYSPEIRLDGQFQLSLGGGWLNCVSISGHTKSDLCFFDNANHFLVIGDSLSPLETKWLVAYEDIDDYLTSLDKIETLVCENKIAEIYTSHYGCISPAELRDKIVATRVYCQKIDEIVNNSSTYWNNLYNLTQFVCTTLDREIGFLGMVSVQSHLRRLGIRHSPG